jgi:hypothetical protein
MYPASGGSLRGRYDILADGVRPQVDEQPSWYLVTLVSGQSRSAFYLYGSAKAEPFQSDRSFGVFPQPVKRALTKTKRQLSESERTLR